VERAWSARTLGNGHVTIGTSGCGAAFADADEKADQPQDYQGDPPQDVEDEAQAAQEQGEQEHEQDECHQVSLSMTEAQVWPRIVQSACLLPRRRRGISTTANFVTAGV
jgi:hypothetical protein